MMAALRRTVATAWSRPAVTGAEGPRPRDIVLVAVAAAASIIEGAARPDLDWPVATILVTLTIITALLWRRTRPLLAVAIMTGMTSAFALADALMDDVELNALVTTFVLLTIPYALFRWGSGRARITGAVIIAAGLLFSSALGSSPIADTIAGVAFLGGACLIGALRRERVESRARLLDTVRAREREALARDLHDTVAHHVSAIVIHAQVASTNPEDTARVAGSLGVIESEAQAVLADMRSLVRTLRAPTDYAPTAGLDELARLTDPGPPPVTVQIDAPEEVPGIVASTLFRLAQEGVTNARRHAVAATAIDVSVTVDAGTALITVRDDGAPARPAAGGGHGLQGMAERAALLGGEVVAGPGPARGWTLRASLPLQGNA
jgi:signal transduction histidine kinase